ncbi:MAG: transglutaminase domain-containing protein [Luteimonas sp.]|nr:transglutaminase domain-containing protein [Luteimonas sp.]
MAPVPRARRSRGAAARGALAIAFVLGLALCIQAARAAEHEDLRGWVRALSLPSPYRIPASARDGIIQYRIVEAPGAERRWTWPETGEQHVRATEDGVVLTVCRTCGREPAPDQPGLDRYLRPGPLVESDDPKIVSFARAGGGGSVDARMRRLVDAVQARMSGPVVHRDYAGARAALDAREGDCTEFALLLAAAARARGIPTRVAAGVAYGSRFVGRPHAFGPHMWVQAWNGERWVSYDAGLGRFDAGHLALVVGDGSPASLEGALDVLRRLRIAEASELRIEGPAVPE